MFTHKYYCQKKFSTQIQNIYFLNTGNPVLMLCAMYKTFLFIYCMYFGPYTNLMYLFKYSRNTDDEYEL